MEIGQTEEKLGGFDQLLEQSRASSIPGASGAIKDLLSVSTSNNCEDRAFALRCSFY